MTSLMEILGCIVVVLACVAFAIVLASAFDD